MGSVWFLRYAGQVSWQRRTQRTRATSGTGEIACDTARTNKTQLRCVSPDTSGANAWLNLIYSSGLASSVLYDGGPRQQRTEVNLLLSSGQRLIKSGLRVDGEVQNLFASKQVINFQSAFSGTRFQQGRRVLLDIGGKF